jgi:hypothetical protein
MKQVERTITLMTHFHFWSFGRLSGTSLTLSTVHFYLWSHISSASTIMCGNSFNLQLRPPLVELLKRLVHFFNWWLWLPSAERLPGVIKSINSMQWSPSWTKRRLNGCNGLRRPGSPSAAEDLHGAMIFTSWRKFWTDTSCLISRSSSCISS